MRYLFELLLVYIVHLHWKKWHSRRFLSFLLWSFNTSMVYLFQTKYTPMQSWSFSQLTTSCIKVGYFGWKLRELRLKMVVSFLEIWDFRRTRDPGETVALLVLTVAFYYQSFQIMVKINHHFLFSVSLEGKVKNVQKSQMWLLGCKKGMVGVTVFKNLVNWKSAR